MSNVSTTTICIDAAKRYVTYALSLRKMRRDSTTAQ